MRLLCLASLFLLVSSFAFAQNGTLSGKIIDAKTMEPIIGANVVIEGTTVGSATDLDGIFEIKNLKPGTYSVVVSFVTYKTQVVKDVVVEGGKVTSLEVPLPEEVSELSEVVVTAKREINTDANLLRSIRESKLVVSGISAEQITRLPDRDAAQVMQRVPGVTIVDNRFVVIRGVPERYNQVMVNGAIAPSTEIDRRSFSFDLIGSSAIDQMLTYKSATAELPGDFAGGVIQMNTKEPANEDFTNVGLNFGYRTNATFEDRVTSAGSSTDWLGFDNGFRSLPGGFPSTQALQASLPTSATRERAGKSLTNNFAPMTEQTPMNVGFNFGIGRGFNIGNVRVSNVTSLTYSNSYTAALNTQFYRYDLFTPTSAETRFEYVDNYYSNDIRFNIVHNWRVDLNDRHKFEFKNLFVQLGEHESTERTGVDYKQNPNWDRLNYSYHYLSRSIYSGQLTGSHKLGDGSSTLGWMFGLNAVERNEPDYRRFRTYRDKAQAGTEAPYAMLLPSNTSPTETGRFWSKLNDLGYSNALNFEKVLGGMEEKRKTTIKAGYYAEYKTRSFNARYVNYLYPGIEEDFDPAIGAELIKLPLTQVFAPENIKRNDGFVIQEGTRLEDSYTGENMLGAGYVSGSMPLGKFDLTIGFRGEYNVQKLSSRTAAEPINVNNPIFSALPSVNAAYNLTDRFLIRVAYGRTVNRPEFRELSPFLFYNFEFESLLKGNPNLKTATIDNFDLRWEMYPNPGEALSIGAFYKRFQDPIELYLSITENPQQDYGNAPSATSTGIELEFRKSLASLGVSKFLRNTSFNLNAAWINSNVDVGVAATNQVQNRPLQGQSPYIINLGLYYFDEVSGFSVNTAYNVFGPRIVSVGDTNFPTWWEMPRHSVDVQIAKVWKKRFETKLNVRNLLDATYSIFQDNNNDNTINTDQEALIRQYQVGALYTLSFSWKFGKL